MPCPGMPMRLTPMTIGQPAPIITASPALMAIARLCRLIQVATARPRLAINAPWTIIVAAKRAAPKSNSARDILS